MKKIALCLGLMVASLALSDGLTLQFARELMGKTVAVSIDGRVEYVFAGKLVFRSQFTSFATVCGDIRAPITKGQFSGFAMRDPAKVGGNVAKAGMIVSKYFEQAKTPEQCAGLQIAVWEALEYGDKAPEMSEGPLQVDADPVTMRFANAYFAATQAGPPAGDGQQPPPAGAAGQQGGPTSSPSINNSVFLDAAGSGAQSQFSTAPQTQN